MANIIDAIYNLINNPVLELKEFYENKNRANSMGDALEEYVKDLFSNTINYDDDTERLSKISDTFSYLGNTHNPPDMMLKNGDAIEVKKTISISKAIALNSSYPKHKIYANSKQITKACRTCEDWNKKDIIYIIGEAKKTKLTSLCMIYGQDYAAENETYERIRNVMIEGIHSIPNVEFTKTKEFGKVKKIDPLGITDLRIRGMWSIESPYKVFEYVYKEKSDKSFNFMCIINNDKYDSFDNVYLLEENVGKVLGFNIADVKIKDPNNPALLKGAKLITFQI